MLIYGYLRQTRYFCGKNHEEVSLLDMSLQNREKKAY